MNRPHLPPRLVPDEPLPPYSYVTGRFPHPESDPKGHSFGHRPPAVAAVEPERWSNSRPFLLACDLFNHGYYWESHELWESLWHACGRHGPTADMLKGLIKLAAAGVKVREGRTAGVERHARRAAELFSEVRRATGVERYLGLNLADWIHTAEELARAPVVGSGMHEPVEIVFDFQLLPSAADGTTGAD